MNDCVVKVIRVLTSSSEWVSTNKAHGRTTFVTATTPYVLRKPLIFFSFNSVYIYVRYFAVFYAHGQTVSDSKRFSPPAAKFVGIRLQSLLNGGFVLAILTKY